MKILRIIRNGSIIAMLLWTAVTVISLGFIPRDDWNLPLPWLSVEIVLFSIAAGSWFLMWLSTASGWAKLMTMISAIGGLLILLAFAMIWVEANYPGAITRTEIWLFQGIKEAILQLILGFVIIGIAVGIYFLYSLFKHAPPPPP